MGALKRIGARALEAAGGLSFVHFFMRNTPRIVMYHRVVTLPFVTGLDPDYFEQQIEYLVKHFRVVPLNQLISELKQRSVKPHTLALTFDDGYSDFYFNAWPILRKHGAPASLFVTTGFVDRTYWLWPDRLRYALLNTEQKHVQVEGVGSFSLDRGQVLTSWSDLGDHCLGLPPDARSAFITNLATQLGVDLPVAPVEPFTAVTWDQLREMKAQGLDIGSHTSTHPILSLLSASEIETELAVSAQRIQQETGDYPAGICYPNGRLQDINGDVVKKARQLNYDYGLLACNALPDPDDIYRVGRIGAVTDLLGFKWRLAGVERVIRINKAFDEY